MEDQTKKSAPTLKERAQQMLEDEHLLLGMFEEGDLPKWFDYLKDKVPSEAVVATLLEKALNDKDVRAIETLNKISEEKTNALELIVTKISALKSFHRLKRKKLKKKKN